MEVGDKYLTFVVYKDLADGYYYGIFYLYRYTGIRFMFGRLNIIKTGIVLLVVFMTAVVLIGHLLDITANRMHERILREVGTYQVELITQEFKKTEELQKNLAGWIAENEGSEEEISGWFKMVRRLDAKLSRVWIWNKNGQKFWLLGSNDRVQVMGRIPSTMSIPEDLSGQGCYSGVRMEKGIKYWTICRQRGEWVLGFDISLPDLHAYFAMSPTVRSYAFILNESGMLITHPDELRLGNQLTDKNELEKLRQVISSGKEIQIPFFSAYLSLPVDRVYYPLSVGSEKWVVAVNIPQLVYQEEMADFNYYTLLIAVLTILVFIILLGFSWYKWRKEYDLRRRAEKEALELNMQQLKNQINPHFLFNSLNSLSILIGSDSELAKEFVLKLSKVYRYLLEKRNDSLATVGEELEFARQYYFLQKIRFGEQLILDIKVDESVYAEFIPVLSLQLLIENAVKHNEVTRLHPLYIIIYFEDNSIIVENNYQPRTDNTTDSLGVGLDSIRKIYEFCSDRQFIYQLQGSRFVCRLPLINK